MHDEREVTTQIWGMSAAGKREKEVQSPRAGSKPGLLEDQKS